MHVLWSIRLKAFLMLAIFTANFTVFCHCARAEKQTCCCEKQPAKKTCHNNQAVKFNLAEKLIADQIQAAPLAPIELPAFEPILQPIPPPAVAVRANAKHPPPDILALHQRLLI